MSIEYFNLCIVCNNYLFYTILTRAISLQRLKVMTDIGLLACDLFCDTGLALLCTVGN